MATIQPTTEQPSNNIENSGVSQGSEAMDLEIHVGWMRMVRWCVIGRWGFWTIETCRVFHISTLCANE